MYVQLLLHSQLYMYMFKYMCNYADLMKHQLHDLTMELQPLDGPTH